MTLKPHRLAAMFPPMAAEEFEGLKADMAARGQVEPIAVRDGWIYDGRHRYRACVDLGLEPIVTELAPDCDVVALVLSKNLHRRHLTTSQRAIVAAQLATLADDAMSIPAAAAQLNVSPRSVSSAKAVIDQAAPEIVEAVQRGEMPVSFAARVVAEEQDQETQSKLFRKGGRDALEQHISEASTYADPDDELRVSVTKRVQSWWGKLDKVGQTALYVAVCELYRQGN